MKKFKIAALILLLCAVSGFAQAHLYKNGKMIQKNDTWLDIRESGYELKYLENSLALPNLSCVFFNEDGAVRVIHFPKIKGSGEVIISIDGEKYSINGIAFYDDGRIATLWFNRLYEMKMKTSKGFVSVWPAGIDYCFIDPFGLGSVFFNQDGTIRLILLEGVMEYKYGNRIYHIKDRVCFYSTGEILSIRFAETLDFDTPLGRKNIATAGFFKDGILKYVTIKVDEIETKYGKIRISKSIDFHRNGSLFVTHLDSVLTIMGKTYSDTWIGFDPDGNFIGEMEYRGDDWSRKDQ